MRLSRSQKTSSVSVEPTGSKRPSTTRRSRKLPLWPKSQSRPPCARENGCVFASLFWPHVAVRMWTTKMDDARWSHAFTISLRMLPFSGAGSFRTDADGSPPG